MTSKFKLIHHVDQKTIDEMYNEYSPVFILSTGRSGSKFITHLLNYSSNITAYHEPRPTLLYFSNFAYHNQNEIKILANMINGARMELVMEVFIKDKIYVESNQCLTFFAPVIANLFKKSKLIHLIRHPGDFVRSAVRKGWHKNDSIWESGRVKKADENRWAGMDQIERLSWLWNTTNTYIEDFKKKINHQRSQTIKFEELVENTQTIKKLLKFTGGEKIKKEKITEMQTKKFNELEIHPDEPPTMKKMINFPQYNNWDDKMKYKLKVNVEKLALSYDYLL